MNSGQWKTYFLLTYGCQMNASDSERVIAVLEGAGLKKARGAKTADLVVINTCGVRQTAENRAMSQVHNIRLANPAAYIVITGCLAERTDVQKKIKGKASAFWPTQSFPQKFELANKPVLNSSKKTGERDFTHDHGGYLKIMPRYASPSAVCVPIMTGCDNYCSYCVVPYARGPEWSRPVEEIIAEVTEAQKNGAKEVTLLGQNVNSYTFIYKNPKKLTTTNRHLLPQKVSFPILLSFLAQTFRAITFRFLTSHPKDFSDELIEIIADHSNIAKEIHLPIQSGSSKTLAAMNRPYTREHYLRLINKIKKRIPEARFSTDVIVGFPGETEEDFQGTVLAFKKVRFFEAYVNKYSPRPGTVAYPLGDPIPWEEKKRREKIIRGLVCKDNRP